jgi:structural maintenance of chromosome 3 (chondroitin sulfate proteoglycan 6)
MEEVHRSVRQMEAELSEMEERLRMGGTSRELRSLVRQGEEQLVRLRRELRILGQGVEELETEVGADMNSQITLEEKERCEELTRTRETLKKEFKAAHGKKFDLDAEYLDVSSKLKRAEEEVEAEKVKRKSKEEAEKTLQLLEIELEEVKGTLLKEKEMLAKIQERGEKAAKELEKAKKALEDLESEEKRLSGIVAKEEAEVQKLLESAARLRMDYSKLVNKRDALGGVAPELIQRYKGKGRKELGKLLEKVLANIKKCRGVNQKADDQFATFTKEKEKLSIRRDELVATKDEVQDTLAMLDHQKTEQILYTYRQLYRNFAIVFKELVPAGQGEILLTGNFETESDEQQLEAATGLSTSVTFGGDAEPRRNMEQLSGGQKTLVALAFILAIQRCDPAPFYLFDEVDAALDADYRFLTLQLDPVPNGIISS